MKVDIWMPLYVNDYLSDTMHLSAEENGAYLLLIMHYWKKGTIGTDINRITKIARVNKEIIQPILDEFFDFVDDEWVHHRIKKEMDSARSRRESASRNGKKGGRPRKNNPEKTEGLNEGCENNNPQENSSSSSSSSHIPLPLPKQKSNKKVKHKHGEYKHVLLTTEEHDKLVDKWGDIKLSKQISQLDEGIELKGYKYKSHYLALLKWEKNTTNTEKAKSPPTREELEAQFGTY